MTIILEILYFISLFTFKFGSDSNLMFIIPLILFSIMGLAEFILWARNKFDQNDKSSKIKLLVYLPLTMLMIFANVTVLAMIFNPRT
ncbi:MAG: hypothetical protein PUG50_06000 [Eubacteriales bacterium]|uniref:hypothetical protein n=1 Tax=Fenollaria sp. TaxID=1965292 RepID=UPI002A74CCBD|nr:hypothetical protein [Fenollaria sp.]MDD7340116.1 hypothetical protein [Eubacteriales bacterium]MDY3105916.1 hypothetical protein [Fenollaria sp.]